jgi:hypothetical protein
LYVQIFANSTTSYLNLYIDDVRAGAQGGAADGGNILSTNLYIVPSGSTYEAIGSNGFVITDIKQWQEARMPVAVGTGGKTVAFRGEMSAAQSVEKGKLTLVNLSETSIDTDNALTDRKFKPSVAGYYQVNGSVSRGSGSIVSEIIAVISKTGSVVSYGSTVDSTNQSTTSHVSDIVYLNGTTDYLELKVILKYTSNGILNISGANTYLSAVLVSGGSSSGGDSIWTEEDGKAVYDGGVKVGDNAIQTTSAVAQLSLQKGAVGTEFTINNDVNGDVGISSKGNMIFNSNGSTRMSLLATGSMKFNNVAVWGNTTKSGNLYVDPANGMVSRSTATMYSAEEVDKKLAVMQKIIDKLEKRIK